MHAIVLREQTLPYNFFCEERFTLQQLNEMINLCYLNQMSIHNLATPSFGMIYMDVKTNHYPTEVVARMLIKDDYNPHEFFALSGFDGWLSCEQIKEGYQVSQKTLDEFLIWIEQRFFTSMTDPAMSDDVNESQKKMEKDLKILLLQNDFFFADCDHYDAFRSYEQWSNKEKEIAVRKEIPLFNMPIKGVW